METKPLQHEHFTGSQLAIRVLLNLRNFALEIEYFNRLL